MVDRLGDSPIQIRLYIFASDNNLLHGQQYRLLVYMLLVYMLLLIFFLNPGILCVCGQTQGWVQGSVRCYHLHAEYSTVHVQVKLPPVTLSTEKEHREHLLAAERRRMRYREISSGSYCVISHILVGLRMPRT